MKCLNLYLIKPSKYDDDGYVIRYWKGVLPSNTLACLNGLSEDLRRREVFGKDFELNIHNMDETVQWIDVNAIVRQSRKKNSKTVVCLVGVQSNQFPRAADLALDFRKAGIDVLIGGFHISGVLAMLPEISAEVRELQEAGVSIVAGEVEGRWEGLLKDALEGKLQPVYNYLKNTPDLQNAPMPVLPKNLLSSYAVRNFATLDCGRGCPYGCSFCTVINVQGRAMRFRPVDAIIDMIRENYLKHRITFYFFTDDNFSRNKNWRVIFERLILLQHQEDIHISFMLQVDTQSHKIPDFIDLAAQAGCSQVFIGLESLNEKNLQSVGKKQNKVLEFRDMTREYHAKSIATHMAYIIGFPFDSEESVAEDVRKMREDLNAQQASFFMMTLLPGSEDYRAALGRGMMTDSDLNNFDTFHETFRHPQMQGGAWTRAYQAAWESFYSVPSMIRILKQTPPVKYWDIFLNFIWYKNAVQVEGGHPMLHGFVRRKKRTERRKNFNIESRFVFLRRRVADFAHTLRGWFRLALEMEEVWLATRPRSLIEKRVIDELDLCSQRWHEWRNVRVSKLQGFYRKAAKALEASQTRRRVLVFKIPSRFQLWIQKWNVFSERLTFTRSPMRKYWGEVVLNFKKGKIFKIRFFKTGFACFREFVLMARFLFALARQS